MKSCFHSLLVVALLLVGGVVHAANFTADALADSPSTRPRPGPVWPGLSPPVGGPRRPVLRARPDPISLTGALPHSSARRGNSTTRPPETTAGVRLACHLRTLTFLLH